MLDSFQDLIEGLTETPSSLRAMLGQPVPDDLADPVKERLAELCTREKIQVRRVQAVMRERQARLRAIQYEPELASLDEQAQTPEEMLLTFNDQRSELISLLVNLTLKDWDRKVDHETEGEITLADEIDQHLTWDEEMLAWFRDSAD
jgi:glycyl-tRNA synthetase beta subunit